MGKTLHYILISFQIDPLLLFLGQSFVAAYNQLSFLIHAI